MNKDMKILVTGVKGQLGFDCVRELKERGYKNVLGIDRSELDITDRDAVLRYIEDHKPDVIMHNAAYTAVDKAEENKEACKAVNVLGVRYITEAAKSTNAKLVYISTDYVFDGLLSKDKEYSVTDTPHPVSEYGLTKWEGEEEARKWEKTFIVRISWVFGINGHNFVRTMLKLGKTHKELNVVDDQIGSPTYTYDLSKLLCDMIETEKYGTYQATNEDYCSWNGFAKAIFKESGQDVLVHEISTEDYLKLSPQQARRPFNSRMSKKSLDEAGFERLPTWQDALHRYIEALRKENEL